MACFGCMLRTSGTLGVAQNRPTSMPLTPNRAVSTLTARSHCATSWQPAAVARPCTRAMTGIGSFWIDIIILLHCANRRW